MDGACAFFLFALYFESIATERRVEPVDADKYDQGMAKMIQAIQECLKNIDKYDLAVLHARLDSFARTALRVKLP
jgi:hypothetical protein